MAAPSQPTAVQSKKHSKLDKQNITQGLNQLYAPKDFDADPKCVEIIAVPGLGSDMTYTWISKGVHWLRDNTMLPKAIPQARVLVYGYRSQWYGPDAVDIRLPVIGHDLLEAIKVDRRECKNKKRPIIFVGHSLGGLVVSKAVSIAKRESERYKGLIDCITACVFLGTPFHGSAAQSWGKLIGTVGSVLGQANYTSLIKTMKSGSSELDDLRDEFLADVGNTRIDVECYFEQEKTYNAVIVDERSASLEGKPRHPWARNHSEMNKFEGPKDHCYRQLSGSLKDMVNQSFRRIKLRQDALKQDIVNDQRVDKVLESLEVNNPRKDLNTIRLVSGLAKGMKPSSWIQQNDDYTGWRDEGSSQTMWICGSAGKGKTMAALAIVEELTQRVQGVDDGSLVLGHFFCDEQDKDKSNGLNVLKSLAWQLLRIRKDLARHFFGDDPASKAGGKSDADFDFSSLPDLWKCLKMAFSDPSLGTVYFVVNSLDQIDLESRKELLGAVTSFRPPVPDDEDAPSGPLVKWLFLSAPRDDLHGFLHGARILNLDDGSNSDRQDDDLRMYVSQKVTQIAQERKFSRPLEYFVKSFIALRARGKSNYDWVNLVCLELENEELSQNAVRARLEELPTDLYPMYDQVSRRVLRGIDIEVEYAKEILRCLLLVQAPPTLQELAIVAGLPETDRDNRTALKKHVERCGALTKMIKVGSDIKVQLSHTSVREFLRSKASDWLSMGTEQIQHGVIALRCFDYVLAAVKAGEETEAHPVTADNQIDDHIADSDVESEDDDNYNWDSEPEPTTDAPAEAGKVLLRYPVIQWIEHALQATADIVDNLGVADVFWLLESKERAEWSRSYADFTTSEAQTSEGLAFDVDSTALHIAAYFGYVPLANLLLKSDQHDGELHAIDTYDFQPLYWACRRGHLNMVQRLHTAGVEINYQTTEEHETALHAAVRSSNPEVTMFLLNHEARVNCPNKKSGSPLYMACEAGLLSIVQQLLESQADPNLTGGPKLTALNAAVSSGELDIVKALLDRGAELNPTVDFPDGNAVCLACQYDELEIAEYLLREGCRWDIVDSEGSTPIEIAAEGGNADIVQLLLQYDKRPEYHEKALLSATRGDKADVVRVLVTNCPNIARGEAFYEAASSGYTEIVEILTAAGVEAHILEKSLYEAVDYQYEETVRVLLDMGLDPNAEGDEYGNALQASAYDGTTEILKMLLDKGAHSSRVYPNSDYGTALQAACYEGTLENVEILLDRGAQANPEVSGEYGTPLTAACAQGNTEIVRVLLEHGADPNTEGSDYGYAIVAAADCGDEEMLQLLISHKADVNVQSPDGDTALTNAALELPMSCLELLIDHGAYLHAKDADNDTALTNAASVGDEDSVRYLLEQGLDINHVGKWGGALYRAIAEGKSTECVHVLLEYHVNVNQEGGQLHTPLQAAAHSGNLEWVELLLDNGANVNTTGGKYHSALQAAVVSKNLDLVRLLLEHGADATETGGDYGSALHAAMYADEPIGLIDLLLEHEADLETVHERGSPLQLASAVATTDVVTHLLEKKANPNLVIGKYGTPLQAACHMEDEEIVDELLEHDADPFLQGGYYGSAFAAAAANGMEEYVQKWLSLDPPSEVLVEALHYAVHFRQKDTVEALLEHGADAHAESRLFKSALLALEADITTAERKVLDGDDDFWWPDENDDEDDDTATEGGDEDNKEKSEGYNEDADDSMVDRGEDAEAEAEAEKEIRALLNPVIQEHASETNDDEPLAPEPLVSGPGPVPERKPITRRPVAIAGTEPSTQPTQYVTYNGLKSNEGNTFNSGNSYANYEAKGKDCKDCDSNGGNISDSGNISDAGKASDQENVYNARHVTDPDNMSDSGKGFRKGKESDSGSENETTWGLAPGEKGLFGFRRKMQKMLS
ncbi:ankyrin repeat-containing domain protein [Aspergillus karnatakaensis]|uniref:ankyrin repeat-containing domain protein n=1 Tax=Aspergillus karnatakaensis TaxID=1810916 RepID=UPI003CCDC77E